MAALFGLFALPAGTVRGIAAWKEIGLALLTAFVILRSLTGHGPRNAIAWPDLWVSGLMTTAVLFLLTENLWLRFDLPKAAEFMGIRDAVYFMLAYFVGRATPELVSDEKTMRWLFALVLFTCLVGILELLLVTPEMLVALGVASYFQSFLGVASFTVGNEYGLPINYWTGIGGHLVRRAGSVYLNGQGFAIPFLLFYPVTTAWVFMREKLSPVLVTGYALITVALLLTLTRMTILVALIQTVLLVTMLKRPEWTVAGLTMAAAMFLAALVLMPGFPTFVWQTLSFQESSSASHATDWANGLAALAQNPWGSGLGTTDQTAVRTGLRHITGDNLYLKYAVEMGVVGLLFFVMTLSAIGNSALRVYRYGKTLAERRMGIALWLATVGIAINGITAVVFNSITLGWLYFWLAGAGVTAAEVLSRASTSAATGPLEALAVRGQPS
ncbi:MAG: O-antigen ligase family protein [Gemmatimonadaceae bacterium]